MEQNHIYRILSILFYISCYNVQAGPVIRPSRMVREIYPEVEQDIPMPESRSQTQVCIVGDIVYGLGETVPFEQPCLKCTCSPPDVRCETEICVPQPGCKAIHRPNKCCPDYQCECKHEGKTYGNGERLPMSPGGECWVCYCRGGEVQCAEVGCYTRSDCKPKYVTGQCCPKYDHCPPRDPLSDRIQYTTESQLSSTDDLTTFPNSVYNITKSQPSTEIEEGSGEISSTVTTTPISTTSESHPQTNAIIEEVKPRPVTPVTFSIKEIELKSNNNKRADTPIVKLDKGTQTDVDGRPQITIQEVIPPRSEFKPPFVPPVHKEFVSVSPINPVTYKLDTVTTIKPVTEVNDLETFSSEKTEVYNHPPPVLRIGDQLLFINKGQLVPEKDASTPTPIITLIGAEGLQIGLGSGEIEPDVLQQTEDLTTRKQTEDLPTRKQIEDLPTKKQTESSTTRKKEVEETTLPTETTKPEEEYIFMSTSSNDVSTETSSTKIQDYIPEENPYYPPIPEDIMNLGPEDLTTQKHSTANTINLTEVSSTIQPEYLNTTEEISVIPLQQTTAETKILPEVFQIVANSTYLPKRENQTDATSLEWLKNEPTKISIPLMNENAALPDAILSLPAASDSTSTDGTDPTDLTDPTDSTDSTEDIPLKVVEVDLTQNKPTETKEKIVFVEPTNEQSKETIELNEETFESAEYTTKHSSLMSNEDASVEAIKNASPEENSKSKLSEVEIIPGYENPIDRVLPKKPIIENKTPNELDNPKNDVEMIPIIELSNKTHEEVREDIQKRDVVKKVLKDVFINPKENIQTDVIPDPDPDTVTDYPDYSNEELNNVKPNENFLTPPGGKNINTTKIILHKITTEKQLPETNLKTETENVQKVNDSKESSEKLSATTLSVLRDFFKTQFKQYHNSKLTD